MDLSIIIATANRADQLADTLASLSAVRTAGPTELLVVDNRSTDHTRDVIEAAAAKCPFVVRYLFEEEPGKYAAVNTGLREARGAIVVSTDDDARFEGDWIAEAVDGLKRHDCDFVGGRVRPLWSGPKPAWIDERSSLHAKVIALLDHGPDEREFGRGGISWPLGVNIAYRRSVFDRVGLFDNRLGRKTGTLRNQSQREWHLRARAAGARGFYLPRMVVHHLVTADRFEKRYFRRWLYWHGISRALLHKQGGYDLEEPELEHPPHAGDREIAGVPVHLIRKAARSARSLMWRTLRGDGATAFQHELWLCFFAGVVRQRWRDRGEPPATAVDAVSPPLAEEPRL